MPDSSTGGGGSSRAEGGKLGRTEANGPALVQYGTSVLSVHDTIIKVSCREVNSGLSILLPVNIHSVSASLVLDTGAAVTVVSSNVYNKLPPDVRPELEKVNPSLKLEVANDELLPVLGTVTLDFKIKKDYFQWQCFYSSNT